MGMYNKSSRLYDDLGTIGTLEDTGGPTQSGHLCTHHSRFGPQSPLLGPLLSYTCHRV